MKKLNDDLKSHEFKRVYLLYGNESYLKKSYLSRFRQAVAGEDTMNFKQLDGKEIQLSEVKDFTDTIPFFADYRLLILTDTGLFKSASEGFAEWIGSLPETAVVIFSESEVDKRNKCYKRAAENGYVCELNHPDEEMIGKWILQTVNKRGLQITRDAYNRILECVPQDMESIQNELEKICDYAMNTGSITLDSVNQVITPALQSRVFEMVEAVAAGNRTRSLTLYYDLLALKEPPMRILFLIARQFNQLVITKDLGMRRASRDEIASVLSVRPFVAGKLMDQSRFFTLNALKDSIRYAVELEEAVKTGNLTDTLAVELLIARSTSGRKKG